MLRLIILTSWGTGLDQRWGVFGGQWSVSSRVKRQIRYDGSNWIFGAHSMGKQELLLNYWSELSAEAQDQLLEVARSLAPGNGAVASEEAQLVAAINRRLQPEEQRRLDYLRARNEQEVITPEEHQELLTWVERIERSDAERAEAMIRLAQLRGVALSTIVAEFLPNHVGV